MGVYEWGAIFFSGTGAYTAFGPQAGIEHRKVFLEEFLSLE
jgi:hypothetical protein